MSQSKKWKLTQAIGVVGVLLGGGMFFYGRVEHDKGFVGIGLMLLVASLAVYIYGRVVVWWAAD